MVLNELDVLPGTLMHRTVSVGSLVSRCCLLSTYRLGRARGVHEVHVTGGLYQPVLKDLWHVHPDLEVQSERIRELLSYKPDLSDAQDVVNVCDYRDAFFRYKIGCRVAN